jgi:hypothetical protein
LDAQKLEVIGFIAVEFFATLRWKLMTEKEPEVIGFIAVEFLMSLLRKPLVKV